MSGWSRRRKVVTIVVALVGLWAVAASVQLARVAMALDDGASALRSARREATVRRVLDGDLSGDLEDAEGGFADAASRLDHPVLAPLRALPIASRQVEALDALATAGRDGTAAASDAVADLQELSRRPVADGAQRVDTVREIGAAAQRVEEALAGLDLGPRSGVVGPLGRALDEVRRQRATAVDGAGDLSGTADALADLLEGPEPYLLLGANNAEMRNGSGMFLSASTLHLDGGALSLGEVSPTAELVLPEGTVEVGGDLAENWPWLDPGRDLRNLGLTADFPQSAALAAEHWAASSAGEPVAGVVAIDVDGIRALLRVVGPVEVDGVRYTADDVRGELLRDQYGRFDDRGVRRDQLGQVARAIFERLDAGDWALEDLGTELVDAVAGRHLLVWSTDEEAADAWAAVGADGHLSEDTISAALVNRAANKLDSWIDTEVDVQTRPAGDGRRRIEVTYRIANGSSGDGPPYVVGPGVEGLSAGDHRGLAIVNLPAGTTDVEISGARAFLQGGDGPTVVVGGEVDVPAGATAEVVVTALLPTGLDELQVEPSARIPRTRWTIDGQELEGDRRQRASLDG